MIQHPKIVDSKHYHLWTDALHARALARQANNKWDRGTYVRWCVITSWAVLEIACQDATNDRTISYRFKENLEKALDNVGAAALDWKEGIWKKVTELQGTRKDYIHRFNSKNVLFPKVKMSDNAITTTRAAIKDIYNHLEKVPPSWIDDDEDRGWDAGRKSIGHLTAVHAEADKDNNNTLHIRYVTNGNEYTSAMLPANSEWMPYVDALAYKAKAPIERVRVYRGEDLIYDEATNMRGT